MADLDDVGQKIKGKYQQMKGDIKQDSGKKTEGTWDKIKGKANETMADLKMDNDDSEE